MKKLIFGALVLFLGIIGSSSTVHAANTNNFTISSYTADMTLSRDSDNRSLLAVTETITAEFPSYDQNHGLERAFVKEYDGHSLSFTLKSVADDRGNALEHHWSGDNLRIGDADTYVHGTNVYVISYTMRDVTKYYDTTTRDEFYWDILGTDWQVPITSATITLTIDPLLRSALSGDVACYMGSYGATTTCTPEHVSDSFIVQANQLQPRSGITLALGFNEGTFAVYQQSPVERLFAWWVVLQFVIGPLAIVVLIWFIVGWFRRMERTKELGTIVPEYLPPRDASVTASARVGGYSMSIMTAQLLDLAVRHYVRIYEVKKAKLFSTAQYELAVERDPEGLREEEQELLKDTFGTLPSVGQRINLKELQNNPEYYRRTLNNDADLDKLIRGEYGFRELDEGSKSWARRIALVSLVVGLVTLSFMWLITALIVFGVSFTAWRLTDKGLTLKRYLKGLEMYIRVAETERIKMLQSPETAEKIQEIAAGDPADPKLLIKLYEKVLPYAVLFGQERQWNKQLGTYYETAGSSPDWYTGQAAFNAVVFSSAMSSFTQASSYASSSSSSSGGSSGGGFSGGGGGGGGGGGW
ncbi:MAG TPA: DUF2207 domain-containing protein [Candidatus Saccharibacteria bacterium]|nr:DUF2207 domain-containing protein [Candidatus Saccharibacteria bacterium]